MTTRLQWAILLCMLLFVSCSDPYKESIPRPETQDDRSVNLDIQMPSLSRSSSTAASEQEDMLNNVYILAFKVDDSDPGNVREYFDYKAEGYSITESGVQNIKRFKVNVFKNDYKQRFVVIGNANSKVAAISDSYKGMEKEQLLETLEFENTNKWHSTDNASFVYLPMWGESECVTINDSNPYIDVIKLTRMVSRIDVVLASDQAKDNFDIRSVHMYNTHTNGRITPIRDGLCWDETAKKAATISLPASNNTKTKGPAKIDAVLKQNAYVMPTIYTFESSAPDLSNASDATCVVVGGIFTGDSKETYYRLDFFDKDDKDNITGYKELLRNHLYRMNIMKVEGSGYTTPEEAFNAKSENMTVEVSVWDEGDISDIVFDGKYMLGVSQTLFKLPRKANNSVLVNVTTDYPQGWVAVSDAASASWLKIEHQLSTSPGAKDDLIFSVTDNSLGPERRATITVTAGRLSNVITIIQGVGDEMSLTITDLSGKEISELLFLSHWEDRNVIKQYYKVNWSPEEEDVKVNYSPGKHPFVYGDDSNPTLFSEISGTPVQYDIKPTPMTYDELYGAGGDPFLERETKLYYFIGEGSNMMAAGITLRQVNFELLSYEDASYVMDGSEYTFTVKSNLPWTATIDSDPKKIIKSYTQSGEINKAGGDYKFTIVDDDAGTILNGTAVIRFTLELPDGSLMVRYATINGTGKATAEPIGESNCYMLQPGGNGVRFPVGQANAGDGPGIGPSDKLTVKLLWTDNSNGMAPNGAVSNYRLVDDGPSAQIEVYPGTAVGNAVIGLYVGSTIVWSWHIWVTDYDPSTDKTYTYSGITWMDRNLGATAARSTTTESYGLHYQWGRKDPFPGIGNKTTAAQVPIYDENGNPTDINTVSVSVTNNLHGSINNPMTFYMGIPSSSEDWFTRNNDPRKWWNNTGSKSAYDPCPHGWRVPKDNPWGSLSSWSYYSSYNDGTYLLSNNPVMGYLPLAGIRNGVTGQLQFNNDNSSTPEGYYWSSDDNGGNESRYVKLNTSSSNAWNLFKRSKGLSVRCVKE